MHRLIVADGHKIQNKEQLNSYDSRQKGGSMTSIMSASIMSPSFSLNPNATDLPKTLLSPADIQEAITSYENLLDTAKSYRNALAALSEQANAFGAALEECARLKGLDQAAEGLSNVAGLQYVLANRQSVLSDTVYRSFEIPLRENLENFVTNTEQRRETYAHELSEKKRLLTKREKAHLSLAHKNKRSLNQFREALSDLTRLADDIDKLKSDYFYNCLDDYSETWARVGMRSNIVCKAELSLYTGVAQKAEQLEWSLVGTPDPWSTETRSGDELFAIVPPQEILARPQSPAIGEGLFQSLLGTIAPAAETTPVPPSRSGHTHPHNSEASFFSRNEDIKGLPAMKVRSITASQRSEMESMEDTSFQTPRAVQKQDSPYQDAEEHDQENSNIRLPGANCSEYSTPSRPTSRRTNSIMHVPKTATKAHPMSTTPKVTPRPKTGDNMTSDLEREEKSPSKLKIKTEPTSPGSDTMAWKHSEYSPRMIKDEK